MNEPIERSPQQKKWRIEQSTGYYKIPENDMHLFANAAIAYQFVLEMYVQAKNPEFSKVKGADVCVLGGFFPSRRNIDKFHFLASKNGLPEEQCIYLDFNEQPQQILSEEEKTRFHQMNLKDIATKTNSDGEPLIKPGSVKFIILDHVTEFMDDATFKQFCEQLDKVLAPDGVAVMAVEIVNTRIGNLIRNIRSFLAMGVKSYHRSTKQWQRLLPSSLTVGLELFFPKYFYHYANLLILVKSHSMYLEQTRDETSLNAMEQWAIDDDKLRYYDQIRNPQT